MEKVIDIELRSETLDLLMSIGNENENIESIINRLLEKWNQNVIYS